MLFRTVRTGYCVHRSRSKEIHHTEESCQQSSRSQRLERREGSERPRRKKCRDILPAITTKATHQNEGHTSATEEHTFTMAQCAFVVNVLLPGVDQHAILPRLGGRQLYRLEAFLRMVQRRMQLEGLQSKMVNVNCGDATPSIAGA